MGRRLPTRLPRRHKSRKINPTRNVLSPETNVLGASMETASAVNNAKCRFKTLHPHIHRDAGVRSGFITRPYFLQGSLISPEKKEKRAKESASHTCTWHTDNSSHAGNACEPGNYCPGAKCRCDRTFSSVFACVTLAYLTATAILQ